MISTGSISVLIFRSKFFKLTYMQRIWFNALMKKILLALLITVSLNTFGAISILSDLDDTIKITQSSGEPGDLVGMRVFTGMPGFLEATKDYTNELHVLSASPSIMRSHISNIFKKYKIDVKSLTLRDDIFEDKFQYKVREIKKILNRTSDDFILIGDDLGEDPEVYAEIVHLYPNRILASYIHVINDRFISHLNLTRFYTTSELYLREFTAGRMIGSRVMKGLEEVMAETRMEFIFPRRAYCPKTDKVWRWQYQTMFSLEAMVLSDKFTDYCGLRQSVIIIP